jgi:hypothetical protein
MKKWLAKVSLKAPGGYIQVDKFTGTIGGIDRRKFCDKG